MNSITGIKTELRDILLMMIKNMNRKNHNASKFIITRFMN